MIIYLFLFTEQVTIYAQQIPFNDEIHAFKKQDSIRFPPKNAILFKSSSFRLWKGIHLDFPGYPIINRGFGGSTIPDVINYAEEIKFLYKPKQVVIYCGENDLATSDSVMANIVVDRFKSLFFLIRDKMPGVAILYVLKTKPAL